MLTLKGDFRVKSFKPFSNGNGASVNLASAERKTLGDSIFLFFPAGVTLVPDTLVHIEGEVTVSQGKQGAVCNLRHAAITPIVE